MSRHGRGLFPAGSALIQRRIKITKKLLLSAMTANAIYVCKHVQCISSVNIDCTPMALALLKVPRFVVHLFCCLRFVYMTWERQKVGLVWVPVLYERKDKLRCYLPSKGIAKECEIGTCISKQYLGWCSSKELLSKAHETNPRHFSALLMVAG